MTLMTRIIADKIQKISVNPRYLRHPRSMNPYIDLITGLRRRRPLRKSVHAGETFLLLYQACIDWSERRGCDSLFRHRLDIPLINLNTGRFYGRSLNPGNNSTAGRLEPGRHGGAGRTHPFSPGGTASSGQTIHGWRAPGTHPANHGFGQRSLYASD